eukprot:2584540-Rhodomonas_salina.1
MTECRGNEEDFSEATRLQFEDAWVMEARCACLSCVRTWSQSFLQALGQDRSVFLCLPAWLEWMLCLSLPPSVPPVELAGWLAGWLAAWCVCVHVACTPHVTVMSLPCTS